MKKKLFFIIPFIILIVVLTIFLLQPKEKEEEKIEEVTSIKSFEFFYTNGYAMYSDVRYYLNCENNCFARVKPYGVSDDEAKEYDVDDEFVKKVIDVINRYEVVKWDGFDRVAKDVLDGDSFSLHLWTKNGIKVQASGYMLWPENYRDVKEKLNNIFNSLVE